MWGQADTPLADGVIGGIIPTRVGTSVRCRRAIACVRDHPHACGDKIKKYKKSVKKVGSSPRVWGQVEPSISFLRIAGIIPTRVGTRIQTLRVPILLQDHPHACGDKTKEIKENSGFAKSTA